MPEFIYISMHSDTLTLSYSNNLTLIPDRLFSAPSS